ncbi:MAG: prolyl oligopeptidase family serine peptidase [Pseudomonadales bacterium]
MKIFKICTLCTTVMVFACAAQVQHNSSNNRQIPGQFNYSESETLRYLLYLPQGYEQQDKWPLLLFLHGWGEAGNNLNKVKKHGPPKHIARGRILPFIVVSPQNPNKGAWQPALLSALLDDIERQYKVDKSRIYVTGLSEGGFGTWSLANHEPDRFAAIAPVCGGGDPGWAERIKHVNVWAYHGARDNVVPVSESINMVAAIKRLGGNPNLTVYPEVGHDAWERAYEEPGFYTWLLEYSLGAR